MGKKYTSIRKNEPIRAVLASGQADRLADFGDGLAEHADVEIYQADSGEGALQLLAGHTIDLIAIDSALADMAGLELVRQVARLHPFVSSVLVSALAEADFHEETEGLGVLMRLPAHPDSGVAHRVLQHMEKTCVAKLVDN